LSIPIAGRCRIGARSARRASRARRRPGRARIERRGGEPAAARTGTGQLVPCEFRLAKERKRLPSHSILLYPKSQGGGRKIRGPPRPMRDRRHIGKTQKTKGAGEERKGGKDATHAEPRRRGGAKRIVKEGRKPQRHEDAKKKRPGWNAGEGGEGGKAGPSLPIFLRLGVVVPWRFSSPASRERASFRVFRSAHPPPLPWRAAALG
jgi:hypothetical protein